MQTRVLCLAVLTALTTVPAASAQTLATDRPLSAIDWLDRVPQPQPITLLPDEPNVSNGADVPGVSVATLDGPAAQSIGLVPSSVSGLPRSIWAGTDAAILAANLAGMPTFTLPAAQAMLFTLLLTEADPAAGASDIFDLARVDALVAAGALNPALALIEQIGPSRSPAVARRYIDASLLNETEDAGCSLMNVSPFLTPDYTYRIFCAARAGDWNTASLLLGNARALDTLDTSQVAVLERFLDPELFEGDPALPRPTKPNPLLFRMHEALGQPISTRSWPVIYANADLRDVVGWKTQIEAAERLALTGALPANRLLGIYSERQPAASGGIWDRVAAVQRFETALDTSHLNAIAKTMPKAWSYMQSAQLSVPFATLFSERLLAFELPASLQDAAFAIVQSGAGYEEAASAYPQAAARHPFRTAVASGGVASALATSPLEIAIARGFISTNVDTALLDTAKNGELGRVLLSSLRALHAGTQGDMGKLSTALATLRALGLEDAARRASLQLLIGQANK